MSEDAKRPGRKQVDWEAIEREYRADQLSVAEIGRQYGVSHTAINKRAKAHGWQRDLADRVRRRVSAQLVAEVAPEVSAARETETIELAARRGVEVVRQHRQDIQEASRLVRTLLTELNESTVKNPEIIDAINEEYGISHQRRAAMLRAVALPMRSGVIRELSQSAKILIELERRAFNLDEHSPDEAPDVKASARERIAGRILGIAARTAAGGDPS
jgi:type III secretion system FlhB-like substrate exporter